MEFQKAIPPTNLNMIVTKMAGHVKDKHKKGASKYSAENIAYHIRNAICHYRFDILDCNREEINRIHIVDKIPSSDNIITFDLELPFEDFRKFVMKYANICKKELERVEL